MPSIRLRTVFSARSIASGILSGVIACLDSSTSSARYVPPWRSRPFRRGTWRWTVSRRTPSAPRCWTLTLRGKSAQTEMMQSAMMTPMRYFRLDMALPGGRKEFRAASKGISRFDLSQRGACGVLVGAELNDERIRRLEAHRVAQPFDKLHSHICAVPIATRVEEVDLERNGRIAEGWPR